MRSPKIAPAIFIVISTALWSTLGLAQTAADECRPKPGPAAPAGSHWYYRINRADGRHCWYVSQEGAKVRSLASDQSHTPVRSAKPQHARGETAVSTPAQATPYQLTSAQAAPATSAPLGPAASDPPLGGDNPNAAEFAVRWRTLPLAFALSTREPSTMNSPKSRAETDQPQASEPAPGATVKRAEPPRPPSEAAFIPTMLTGTLAILLLVLAAIVKIARRLNRRDSWPTVARRLGADHQLRAGLVAGPREEPAKEPGMLRARSARRTEAATLKADLQQLLRDLRRAEADSEPPRKFEPDARSQLRLLGKFATRRSRLQIFNGEEGWGTAGHQSDPALSSAHPLLRPKSAA